MTKKYFIELSEYHAWANEQVCGWLEKISEEEWNRPLVSSFNSLRETILHVAGAEKIWVERLLKYPALRTLSETFNGSKKELIKIWKEISKSFKKLIKDMPEDQFHQKLKYKTTKGIEYNQPYYQLLAHVINHSTYHRGQVVTMLREVGFTDLNSTDLATFFKTKNELSQKVFNN
jgi:uncharacterized damage-inducible protein DinB